MVPSKTHAHLGLAAAATVLISAMSVVFVRSGGAHLTPAVFVGTDETSLLTQQPRPPATGAPQFDETLPGPMLVVTPIPDRMPRQIRSKSGI